LIKIHLDIRCEYLISDISGIIKTFKINRVILIDSGIADMAFIAFGALK
jgi:hypothetical protein